MKIGIVGLPMTGKTTLFRLLTGAEGGGSGASAGRAEQRQTTVADPRLDRLAEDYSPKKITPTAIDFLDFPALPQTPGQERRSCADLLAPAREAGALIVVVRAFENPTLPPLSGAIDPARDLDEVVTELRYADLDVASGRLERIEKSLARKRGDEKKALEQEKELLVQVVGQLEGEGELAELRLGPEAAKQLRGFQFLSAKPRLVVENRSEPGPAAVSGAIPVMAAIELELSELEEEEREIFASEYGLVETARDRVIREIYSRAGLISFLTAGEKEVRAWTIPRDTPAVEAAGAIHSDISRGFIRAEVVAYEDYVADGGISGARDQGHLRLEGKEYIVRDGDIIEFRFNV